MANYFKKFLRCGCCGASFETDVLAGLYQGKVMGLDTNPYQSAIYDLFIVCPNCGYAGVNITRADQKTIDYIRSDDFKHLTHPLRDDDTEKKIRSAAVIAAYQEDFKAAGYASLVLSWYLRDKALPPDDALAQCIEYYSRHLSASRDYDAAIILIDCLRQSSRFEEANETAKSLLDYIQNARLEAIVKFEQKLISENDASPHLISEVPT